MSGGLIPSTSHIKTFRIEWRQSGFAISYPHIIYEFEYDVYGLGVKRGLNYYIFRANAKFFIMWAGNFIPRVCFVYMYIVRTMYIHMIYIDLENLRYGLKNGYYTV